MNVRRISWGLIVLFVGLILLFSNLGYINFNWFAVFSLWPVLLILLGLSFMLPERSESRYIMVFATVGVLVLFAYQGLKTPTKNGWWGFNFNEHTEFNENERGSDPKISRSNTSFSRDLEPGIRHATLNMDGGAITYRIGKSTNKLFQAKTSSNVSNFSLSDKTNGDNITLDFKMRNQKNTELKRKDIHNNAEINLSATPVWNINLEIGAGKADFDLSDYKIRRLDIEGGVSSIQVKMGIPFENETQIDFDGGLASFELSIPKEAACRIVSDSALSSQKFTGFIKQEDGSFVTDNYNSAEKKFAVSIDSGLSSFSVNRY